MVLYLLAVLVGVCGGVHASDDGWNGIRDLTFATPKGKAEEKVQSPVFGWMSGRNLYKKLREISNLEPCPDDAKEPLLRAIKALKKKANTSSHEKDKEKYEGLANTLETKFFGGAVSSSPDTGQPKDDSVPDNSIITVERHDSACSLICSSRSSDSPGQTTMRVSPATTAPNSEQKTGGAEAVAPPSPVRCSLDLGGVDTGAPRVDSDEEGDLSEESLPDSQQQSSNAKEGLWKKFKRGLTSWARSKKRAWDDVINLKLADRERLGRRIKSPNPLINNITTKELCEKLEAVPDSGCPPEARENLIFMVKELCRKSQVKGNGELKTRCEAQIKRLVEAYNLVSEEEEKGDQQQGQSVEEPAISDTSPDPEDARQKYYIMAVVAGALLMDWAVRRDKSIVGSSIRAVKRLWSYLRGVKKQDEEVFDSAVDQAKELLAQEGIIPEEG